MGGERAHLWRHLLWQPEDRGLRNRPDRAAEPLAMFLPLKVEQRLHPRATACKVGTPSQVAKRHGRGRGCGSPLHQLCMLLLGIGAHSGCCAEHVRGTSGTQLSGTKALLCTSSACCCLALISFRMITSASRFSRFLHVHSTQGKASFA